MIIYFFFKVLKEMSTYRSISKTMGWLDVVKRAGSVLVNSATNLAKSAVSAVANTIVRVASGYASNEVKREVLSAPAPVAPVVPEIEDDWIPLVSGTNLERFKQVRDYIAETKGDKRRILILLRGDNPDDQIALSFSAVNQLFYLDKLDEFANDIMVSGLDHDEIVVDSSDIATRLWNGVYRYTHFKIEDVDEVVEDLLPDLITERKKKPKSKAYPKRRVNNKKSGGFFPYVHLIENEYVTELLDCLSIYSTNIVDDSGNQVKGKYFSKCLVRAFHNQVSDDVYHRLNEMIHTDNYPVKGLTALSKKLELPFKLIYREESQKQRKINYYGCTKDTENVPVICLVEGHYFRYVANTNVTAEYIRNHTTQKDHSKGKRYLSTYELVVELVKNKDKCLRPVNITTMISHPDSAKEISDGVIPEINIDASCDDIELNDKSASENFAVLDFETFPDENGNHRLYLGCVYAEVSGKSRSIGHCVDLSIEEVRRREDKMISMMFDSMIVAFRNHEDMSEKKPFLVFAHNLTYDASFLLKSLALSRNDILINGGRFVSYKCARLYQGKYYHFLFKDSCRLIPTKLSGLPKMLGFSKIKSTDGTEKSIQKEVMFHELFRHDTMDIIEKMPMSEIEAIVEGVRNRANEPEKIDSKLEEFKQAIKGYENNDGTFNLLKYSRFYCQQDCVVAHMALHKFNKLFQELDERMPPIWAFYSLPSLAEYYFYLQGCYDGCVRFNGLLGHYFNQFCVGGRVMLNNNTPLVRDEGPIDDFDACSLYPSAMKFFNGFVTGRPKVWDESVDLDEVDYYFVRVKITAVGKNRAFPVVSIRTPTGRDWTNDLVGKIVPLDKVGLEDAVNFQGIEYEIVDGYYFDEGFNTKINEVIEVIYNRRKNEKKAGNSGMEQVLKLLMNSSYGKLIQKPNSCEHKIISGRAKFFHFLKGHMDFFVSAQTLGKDKWLVKCFKPIFESSSSPHLGCQILSYSKRIMNQVICTAEDIGVEIFYQDTDSIHLYKEDVDKVAEAYAEVYEKDLIGGDLGNFHSDFNVAGLDAKTTYSAKFIGLAKKTYIDCCTDAKGNLGYHVRAKGVPERSIIAKATELECTVEDIYLRAMTGEEFEMDLTVDNGVCFDKGKDFSHSTKSKFTRKFGINVAEELHED